METHIHHIVPKHAGGSDDPSNLKELTILEHAQEHERLYLENLDFADLCACVNLYGLAKKMELMSPKLREEYRKQRSERMKNYMKNPEVRKQISESRKHFIQKNPESRKKMIERISGENHSMKNPESRKKQNESISHNWLITYPDGHQEVIRNLNRFCQIHGLNQGNMVSVSQGKHKHHKGWICCKFFNDVKP